MKNQYLLLSTSAIVVVGLSMSVVSNSALASDVAFSCQSNEGMHTTIITNSTGATQSIFHWKLDKASVSSTPKQLCDSVTQKLNQYEAEGNDLSSLIFKPSTVSITDEGMSSIPAVCVAGVDESCQLTLFTLNNLETDDFQTSETIAGKALNTILDPVLKANIVQPRDRGVQSTSYRVSFWDLLNF